MMASEIKAECPARSQPAKRSLFNKPAWSKSLTVKEEGVDLFSRSNQVYAEVIHEQEDRRRKKLAKDAQRASHEREKSNEPGRKKRRIDGEHRDRKDDAPVVDIDSDESARDQRDKQPMDASGDAIMKSPSRSRAQLSPSLVSRDREPIAEPTTTSKISIAAPIELSDDEDEQIAAQTMQQATDGKPVVIGSTGGATQDEDAMSDEEFPELARQARARAKAKQLEREALTPGANGLGTEGAKAIAESSRPAGAPGAAFHPEPDVKVDILITSQIPNTKPLIVQRRTHQDLRNVRFAWCMHQGYDMQRAFDIFLTWRGKRLFDVTTCKSLGIGVNSRTDALLGGDHNWLGEENLQVHMEAVTEEIFEASKKLRERGVSDEEDRKELAADEGGATPEDSDEQVRIILRGKGYEEFKLIVKSSTKFSRIESAFRQARNIEADREVFLMFDGDKLNAEDLVADTEISDLDHIDVHVK